MCDHDNAQPSVASYILANKGAFCTPRRVIRSITTTAKPTTTEVVKHMKKLDESGLGKWMSISEKEKVFYKALPVEANRNLLSTHGDFETYQKNEFQICYQHQVYNSCTATKTIEEEKMF